MREDNDGGRVAGSYTMQAQLPNGKSLTFSGYVLASDTVDDVHKRLDVAAQVVERQRLAAEIPELEKKLEQVEKAKKQVETIIEDLGGKDRLSSQEKQQLNTMRVNLKSLDDEIRRGQIAIADATRATAHL
jgi:seryl-tRNA synthetase